MTQKSKLAAVSARRWRTFPTAAPSRFGGFAMPGVPFNLIKALLEQGAKQLTLVAQHHGRRATAAHAGYRACWWRTAR